MLIIERFKNSKYFWYLFILILFILFVIYYNKIYIDCGIEGDFGRDLYDFFLVSIDKHPYMDFNWIYGPLSPTLYGTCFKLFGVSIGTATNLYYAILLISCVLIFVFIKSQSNNFFAFLVSSGFILNYSFLIELFNHVFGIIPIIVSLISVKYYLKDNSNKFLIYLTAASILLCLIKLNMALAIIIPIYSVLFLHLKLHSKSTKYLAISILVCISSVSIIYFFLLHQIPIDKIIKSFPYLPSQHITITKNFIYTLFNNESHIYSFSEAINGLYSLFVYLITIPLWHLLIVIYGISFVIILIKHYGIRSSDTAFYFILSCLSISTMHEFILVGTVYSLRYWSLIIDLILVFLSINHILENNIFSTQARQFFSFFSIMYFFIIILLFLTSTIYYFVPSLSIKDHSRLNVSFSGIYWTKYFCSIIQYIDSNIPNNEYLFVLPYNILYNFATDRKYPTRYTEFLFMSGNTPKEDLEVIKDLEKNKVKHIIYSTKSGNIEGGFGTLGITHEKLLHKYINDNYTVESVLNVDYKTTNLLPIAFLKRKTLFK